MIVAGNLRQRLTLQVDTGTTLDNRGAHVENWVNLSILPAQVETLDGKKLDVARQVFPMATHKITMRYYPLDPNLHRFEFEGRIFSIGSIIDAMNQHIKLEVLCKEYYENTGN